ncbi:MAG: hypothetical protein JOY62_17215 [Acidobacteriaceae bacterium]|nr:hypothetical protein [Acidobacteriaceae bacterium]MBV9781705.1 hypothetical protein [Acidobacteriaceae bacterium]
MRNLITVGALLGTGLLSIAILCRTVSAQGGRGANATDDENPCVGYPYPPGVVPCDLVPKIQKVREEIDRTEEETLRYAEHLPVNNGTRLKRIRVLGKLLLYDENLSVRKNTACVFCHTTETGFTGPISEINEKTVAYPGSVRYRFANRRPMSYAYGPYSPVFHFDESQQAFFGGNFWSSMATGWKLQNPNSEQVQFPFVDFDEQGFPDSACVVRRVSQAAYEPMFEAIWSTKLKLIHWPSDVDQVCGTPSMPPMIPTDPGPLKLAEEDRMLSNIAYDQIAQSIAANEAGPDVSPFTSKFDYAIAHSNQPVLTAEEQLGWELFRGKGKCNLCHVDSTSAIQMDTPETSFNEVPDAEPLFSDFEAFNLGLPRNTHIPYYYESKPDKFDVTPNPMGLAYIDRGLGDFLRSVVNPNSRWTKYAEQSDGKFQTATTRDVDKRPYPTFIKAYFHNGILKSLKEVVHFYNTRDVLPKCKKGIDDPGFAKTCWVAPEVRENVDQRIGNLALSDAEEDAIVAFMKTLTDGYTK